MKSLTFQREFAYTGNKIRMPISLILPSDIEIAIEAILDTGAEVTILNRLLAERLSIEIEDGEPIELGVVSGQSSTGYLHDIRLRILGDELSVRAAFVPDWNTSNFLGMRGFFDQMVVAFDHAQRRVYL
jgi:hypothetical protein